DHPATPFVMSFIGEVNVLPSTNQLLQPHLNNSIGNGTIHASYSAFIRPHDLKVQTQADEDTIQAQVKRITHLGWEIQVELILPDQEMVIAHLSREQFSSLDLKIDQQVFIKPRQTKVFSAEKGFLNFAI
ncbi:MAG: TOBE-like domain-containing protein, partial [Microcystaceae cyanobacterium]